MAGQYVQEDPQIHLIRCKAHTYLVGTINLFYVQGINHLLGVKITDPIHESAPYICILGVIPKVGALKRILGQVKYKA